jgi:hypothetical protein
MAIVNVQEDDTPEDSDLGCGVMNARLMAAAPELLHALEALLARAYQAKNFGAPQEFADAQAAIEKARGKP